MVRYRVLGCVVAVALLGLSSLWMGGAWAQEEEPLVTLEVQDAKLGDALGMLFRGSGFSYVLEEGIEGRVTARLNGVPFTDALKALLAPQKLTYRKVEGIYYIGRASETVAEGKEVGAEAPAAAPASEAYYWIGSGGRYELQALDVRQVSAWFGGTEIFMSPIPVAVDTPSGGMGAGGGPGLGGVSPMSATGGLTGIGGLMPGGIRGTTGGVMGGSTLGRTGGTLGGTRGGTTGGSTGRSTGGPMGGSTSRTRGGTTGGIAGGTTG